MPTPWSKARHAPPSPWPWSRARVGFAALGGIFRERPQALARRIFPQRVRDVRGRARDTHSRTLGKADLARMNQYTGHGIATERDLWIWDESLLASSHFSFQYAALTQAIHWLAGVLPSYTIRRDPNRPERTREDLAHHTLLTDLLAFLTTVCTPILESELANQQANQPPKTLRIPTLPTSLSATNKKGVPMWDVATQRLYGRTIRSSREHVEDIRKSLFLRRGDQQVGRRQLRVCRLDVNSFAK